MQNTNDSRITSQPVRHWLTGNSNLAAIIHHAEILRRVNQLFLQSLNDVEFAKHCQVMNWQQGRLTIMTDSAAWATRLRFLTPRLMQTLQVELKELKEINYRVRPNETAVKVKNYWKKSVLSSQNVELLQGIVANVADTKLQNALRKLCES